MLLIWYIILWYAAQATLLADGRTGGLQPLMLLYNKVADNLPQDSDACVSVAALPNNTLRATAAHGYGTLDLQYSVAASWVTFELLALDAWTADPREKHVQLARLEQGLLDPTVAPFTTGKFQGLRGLEGREAWSAGFFTLSSPWQQYNTWFYAVAGQRLAFTIVRTAALPATWTALAAAEGVPPPNPQRAVSWYWHGGTSEATIDAVINRTKALGARLLFFTHPTSNRGDFVADPVRFPSGIKVTADKVRAAGLEVGLHLISPGATIPGHPASAAVAGEHPEFFVPQGLSTRSYFEGTDAGTWWAHEGTGTHLWDHTRSIDTNLPPEKWPPLPATIDLVDVAWSPLGRFRNGSAPCFNGVSSYGLVVKKNYSEYDFEEAFSVQMVVHVTPSAATAGREQTLASRPGAWRLLLDANGRLQWRVHFQGGWAIANGTTVLTADDPTESGKGGPWVVKATVGGGVARVHLCPLVVENAGTPAAPVPARNRCHMSQQGSANATGGAALAKGGGNISLGAEVGAGGASAVFRGALEEIMLSKIDTTPWTRFCWNVPGTGIENMYIFDYTLPKARAFWANATASLFNEAQAATSQWDGAEFQPSTAGWDIPHSSQTFNSGMYLSSDSAQHWHLFWGGATNQAFTESHALWDHPLAVEMSLRVPGFAPWRGDMSPFSDEGRLMPSRGGKGMCVGGQEWVGQMLKQTHVSGVVYNAYNTAVSNLPNQTWVDCFLGALVAAGVPPQMLDGSAPPDPARDARIRYWVELSNSLGHNSEASIDWLHVGAGKGIDGVFFIGFEDGAKGHHGLFYASPDSPVAVLPAASWRNNETVVCYATVAVPVATIPLNFGAPADTTARFFAASAVTLRMGGGFWTLAGQDVQQTLIAPDGTVTTSNVFGHPVSGAQNVTSPRLAVGASLVYTKLSPRE